MDSDDFDIRESYPLQDQVAASEGWDDPAMDAYNDYVKALISKSRGDPSDEDRAAAAARLAAILDAAAENAPRVSDAEFDAALEEAMRQSRGRKDP